MSQRDTILKMKAADTRVLFTKKEAADFYRMSLSKFNEVIKEEKIPHGHEGRQLRFLKDDLYDRLLRLGEQGQVVTFFTSPSKK